MLLNLQPYFKNTGVSFQGQREIASKAQVVCACPWTGVKIYIVNRLLISFPEYVYDTRANKLPKSEKNEFTHKQPGGKGSGFFFISVLC